MRNGLDEFERSLVAASRALHTGNALSAGTEHEQAGRRRPARRGGRRRLFQRRLLLPIFVLALAAGGVAAAHSIFSPSQRLADGTINCINARSGQPPALPAEMHGKPVEGLSLDGESPISYCHRQLVALYGRETPAVRTAALVACAANPTTVDVYLASGVGDQCQANDEKPLPGTYAIAEARLRELQRELTKLDAARDCVSPVALTREVKSALTGLGLVGWQVPTLHRNDIPAGTGGSCGTAWLDTQYQRVNVLLEPSHTVQKELQHLSYTLYSRSYTRCYTATSIRTLVSRRFAAIGMDPRFATFSGNKRGSLLPAKNRLFRAGCVRFYNAWTGNNNKFVDVELVAKGAPRLPPGQEFPPAKDFAP